MFVFFFKQNTAYEMRISDWSSDVCSSDLVDLRGGGKAVQRRCEGERDAAAVAAHDCFTVRPAERLACEVDVVAPARQRRVGERQSRGSFQCRARAGKVEVAAGQPARILIRLGRTFGRASRSGRVCQYVYITVDG